MDISEVNRIVKQFDQMKKMMKQLPGMMGGKKGRGALGGLHRQDEVAVLNLLTNRIFCICYYIQFISKEVKLTWQ